ncbi:hypothetical protein ACS0TY_007021 [Phlomoides rotata]
MIGNTMPWRFTGVYGFPEDDLKWKTWRLLDRLGRDNCGPWMCAGDFNGVLYGFEKMGGVPRGETRMCAFRDYLERSGLSDLGFVGHAYTWSNKQSGVRNIQER